MTSSSIHPYIMAGGAGTRLWPLSRAQHPKQFVALTSAETLLEDTLRRVTGAGFAPAMVVCNAQHGFLVEESLARLGLRSAGILVEPVGRNTAAVAAIAARLVEITDPDGLVFLLPADHAIEGQAAFEAGVARATLAARQGRIVAFGIRPTAPSSAYGHIRRGRPLDGAPGCFAVERFVEKPEIELARRLTADPSYSWNGGMFLFAPRTLLDEMRRLRPDIEEIAGALAERLPRPQRLRRLDPELFERLPSISLDYAVMEQTSRAAVVPLDIAWSDVGSWSSVWEWRDKDEQGNAVVGDAVMMGTRNTLVEATDRLVAAVGVQDLVIVDSPDALLVAGREHSQEVRAVVDRLRGAGRSEADAHRRVHRPWGSYDSIRSGPGFQIKILTVKPGARLSLQMHHHRAEHWVVVEGIAEVTRNDEVFLLREGQHTHIPLGARHRLANPGTAMLQVAEVQIGGYLGEDDIVRFQDDYGREREGTQPVPGSAAAAARS